MAKSHAVEKLKQFIKDYIKEEKDATTPEEARRIRNTHLLLPAIFGTNYFPDYDHKAKDYAKKLEAHLEKKISPRTQRDIELLAIFYSFEGGVDGAETYLQKLNKLSETNPSPFIASRLARYNSMRVRWDKSEVYLWEAAKGNEPLAQYYIARFGNSLKKNTPALEKEMLDKAVQQRHPFAFEYMTSPSNSPRLEDQAKYVRMALEADLPSDLYKNERRWITSPPSPEVIYHIVIGLLYSIGYENIPPNYIKAFKTISENSPEVLVDLMLKEGPESPNSIDQLISSPIGGILRAQLGLTEEGDKSRPNNLTLDKEKRDKLNEFSQKLHQRKIERKEHLLVALSKSDTETVKRLITGSPELLNATDPEYSATPLISAIVKSRSATPHDREALVDLAIWLIEKKADPNLSDKTKNTALHRASFYQQHTFPSEENFKELIEKLILYKASINDENKRNNHKELPYDNMSSIIRELAQTLRPEVFKTAPSEKKDGIGAGGPVGHGSVPDVPGGTSATPGSGSAVAGPGSAVAGPGSAVAGPGSAVAGSGSAVSSDSAEDFPLAPGGPVSAAAGPAAAGPTSLGSSPAITPVESIQTPAGLFGESKRKVNLEDIANLMSIVGNLMKNQDYALAKEKCQSIKILFKDIPLSTPGLKQKAEELKTEISEWEKKIETILANSPDHKSPNKPS